DGIGKLNFSRAERNRDSTSGIPGRAGEIEYLGRDCGRNIWFMAWGVHHLLGVVMAWTDRHRKMGAFFCDQRIKVDPGRTLAASLRSWRNLFRAPITGDPPSHFHSGGHRSNEFHHL